MANERLNIPETLKVGFNSRSDTYSGKLAYVTYINKKGDIAKETSWKGWIDSKIDVETYENKPIEGFVLNRRAGGYKSGWNFRQTRCRVYDPRGFEVEISVENLLYILQECTSSKGKGLEGEFVYAWSGPELILLPVCSEDYKASTNLMEKQEKITLKTLKVGAAYKGSTEDYLIYIGKMEWYVWHRKDNTPTKHNYYDRTEYWDEIRRVLLPTFVDLKNRCFRGIKNLDKLDYLIEEDVITPVDVEGYIDNFKTTPAFTTQFVDKLTIGQPLGEWNDEKYKSVMQWSCAVLYMQKPGMNTLTKIYAKKERRYEGKTEYQWMDANSNWRMTSEERQNLRDIFNNNARTEYIFEKAGEVSYENGKLKEEYCYSNNLTRHYDTIRITDEDWKYISDAKVEYFTSTRDENEKIKVWSTYSLSETEVKFSEDTPLPENELV